MFYLSFATCQNDDDGDYTTSDVCIRFSAISDMKSRNDLRELGLFFEKVT